jgi:pimeloyl-ACP methyl ester carboxylesterase
VPDRFDVEPYPTPIEVGDGITLIAPGLSGEGFHYGRREAAELRADTLESEQFRRALEEADLEDVHTLILPPGAPPPIAEDSGTRSGGKIAEDEVVLKVPANGADSQYVIYQDEDGVMSVEIPERPEETESAGLRGDAFSRVFHYRIRLRRSEAKGETRGVLGVLGRKVMKVIARKLGVAAGTRLAAYLWESRARSFEGFHGCSKSFDAGALDELLTDKPEAFTDWKRHDGKKSLLFVHGTTSTTTGAFGDLRIFPEKAKELFRRYEDRVIGFNHHTLGRGVAANAVTLYDELSQRAGVYTFDIICHSRGGLLARVLKELDEAIIRLLTNRPSWARPIQVAVKIDRIVFVGTPNAGTDLAAPENLPKWLNRMANLAAFIPDFAGAAPLAAVLAVASDLATSVVCLPGLADMAPDSPFLKKLNPPAVDAESYWGVEADYRAAGPLLRALEDPIVDGLFQGKDNDLVVPTDGVSIVGSTFILPDLKVKKFAPAESVSHTHFFTNEATWNHILAALN